jgi:broad specificity phosphatase PhoE
MATIYLVRHGRAAAGFTDDKDPGLDDLGREQAVSAGATLRQRTPLAIFSSPLARARETAEPLAIVLGQAVTIEDRVAEIPSPGISLAERGPWLRKIMSGTWTDVSDDLKAWREKMGQCLLAIETDAAIFSHFVAINVAVGLATGDDRGTIFRPDNGSITTLNNDNGQLTLVERGDEANTHVN